MRRILFILHTPPPVHGSSVVGKTIKDSSIINEAFECHYINLSTSRLVEEIGKKHFIKIGRYFRIVVQVLWQMLTHKPNLCYIAITAKGPAFYKDSLIVYIVKLFSVHIVYHFHNKGVSHRQNKVLDNLLYRKVFKNSHAILLSKYLYPDVEKYFTRKQVYYCPNGIPKTDISHSDNFGQIEIKNLPVKILFLSNLIKSKGVFVLLEACKILMEKGTTFYCTYVGGEGDVSTQHFNKKVKQLELTDHVFFVGRKYGQEKEKYFLEADIFVFPTFYNYECFPLVLLEAMQHRLPTISTFEGGITEIVEDGKTGFLVPQKDVETLAEKLEILIKDPVLRKQMGESGRKKYEKEFTLSKFEHRLKEILSEILNTQNK
ncbi:glycosyltransferase family 4 protein [Petrimonas sp.]|uniref:glycosyltransferase family 4 protein n=1 Tax=Petrimonas sp. TaxID=2023866 RepID=UPI002FCBE3B6